MTLRLIEGNALFACVQSSLFDAAVCFGIIAKLVKGLDQSLPDTPDILIF